MILPVLLAATCFLLPAFTIAESDKDVIESLFRGPLSVLSPSPPPPPHLPPAGHLWTVVWRDEAQGYKLSSSSSASSTGSRTLAHGTLSNASVDQSGWWQLAISTALDLDKDEAKGRAYKTGKRGRKSDIPDMPAHFAEKKREDEDIAWMLRRWYAAGLLEGYLTAPLIAEYALNAKHSLFGAHHYPR